MTLPLESVVYDEPSTLTVTPDMPVDVPLRYTYTVSVYVAPVKTAVNVCGALMVTDIGLDEPALLPSRSQWLKA
ncbi:MAG: hypothetical protein QXE92_00105 [Thermofilaceae archaeon]